MQFQFLLWVAAEKNPHVLTNSDSESERVTHSNIINRSSKLLTFCFVVLLLLFCSTEGAVISIENSGVGDEDCQNKDIMNRKKACLMGLYVADAIAMPVHWMYDLHQLKADYGVVSGYMQPKDNFRGSIMNLSNTGGGGRGSDEKSIIGDVINHGKKKYWLKGGNFHYHLGLKAGENTLEAQLARLLVRSIASPDHEGQFDPAIFLAEYVSFMRTPGSHNDTYASTAHRMFFQNLVEEKLPPAQCAANDGHNTDSIDALTLTVPVIVRYVEDPAVDREALYAKVIACISLTRDSPALVKYAKAWTDLLCDVLNGRDLREAVEAVGRQYFGGSVQAMVEHTRKDPMVACYIESAFTATLHFAFKYADNVEACLLANANAGGENVARGSLLGALMGAHKGMSGISEPAWMLEGLYHRPDIEREVDALLAISSP